MSYNDANEVVNELFDSLRSRYLINLETSVRRSDLIFYSVQFLYYKGDTVKFRQRNSNIDSPESMKKKKNNKSKKYQRYMFSVHGNCCIKLLRN